MASIITDTIVKDYDSFVQSLIDFATIQYGEQTSANRVWSDFNVSSFSRNWAEIVAYTGDQLMFYLDTQANQAYLETATIPAFILRIAQQFGFEIPTQQAATGKVKFTTTGPYSIPINTVIRSDNASFFTTRAISGNSAEDIEVEAMEGEQITETFTASGTANEEITLVELEVIVDETSSNSSLRSPIVTVNGNQYTVLTTSIDAAPNDKIVVRTLDADGRMILTFGDGVFGRRLTSNETINVVYRIGGGSIGNIAEGEINTIPDTLANVESVTNDAAFSGGVDLLSIEQIKVRTVKSLETLAGAVSLQDYGDILIATFSSVLNAKADINAIDSGIDIDVFVIPQADEVTNITDNSLLYDTLTDFLELKKTVTSKFIIKDAEKIFFAIDLEIFLDRDSSRTAIEAEVRDRIKAFFDLQTGNVDGSGMDFAQIVRAGDIFDILKDLEGISRFEIKKFTIQPRIDDIVNSPNQNFYISDVDVYQDVDVNEWLVATSEFANPDPLDGQVEYTVFKRTLANVTSLTENSITDSDLDLTVKQGTGIVVNNIIVTDSVNVFQPGQYDDYLLVDQNEHIWRIDSTASKSITVASPALSDAAITTVASGSYRVVKNFSAEKVAINGISFTIIYNTQNTFFSPGANFNLIATNRDEFFLSEEQTNKGTYGVPVAISNVSAVGASPGDLVNIEFNGNPNLSAVDDEFVLIDRTGESFEVINVVDNDDPVASYNNATDLDSSIILVDSGANESVAMTFEAEKEVLNAFIEVRSYLKKDTAPLGSILVKLYDDNAGQPGTLLGTSNAISASSVDTNFTEYQFTFPVAISFTQGAVYYAVVEGDNAYKISYGAAAGSIEVGIDTTNLAYKPATTAAGTVSLNNNGNIATLANASTTLTVIDNAIRHRLQAKGTITILDNDFSGGTHSVSVGPVTLVAVAGAPGPNEFQIGASITLTRDNLKAAIDSYAASLVTTANISTDGIEFTADETNYSGEAGNSIEMSVQDPSSPTNFQLSGGNLSGGVDGEKLTVKAPKYYNSSSISYTYDNATGIVQYSAAAGLPAFEAGDLFVDGVGAEFAILGIDVGNDKLTLDISLTVDTTVDNVRSGAIVKEYNFEFGVSGLVAGATTDDTAENLRSDIDAIASLTATRVNSIITITSTEAGEVGNEITLTLVDLGTENFTLASETLEDGKEADIVTVDGSPIKAVLGAATPGIEFEKLGTAAATAANLATSINSLANVNAISVDNVVTVTAFSQGSAGNSITLAFTETVEGTYSKSGDTLLGGNDNRRVLTYNGAAWSDYVPDADMIFGVFLSSDSLTVVSKADENNNQVVPVTSTNLEIDSSLGKRYYSDEGEISVLIATQTPNSFIVGSSDVNLYGRGTVDGTANTRVDQFIFRTSGYEADVTNLRTQEIPVIEDDDIILNLLGGVN